MSIKDLVIELLVQRGMI
jgi:hypothetical protein